MNAELLKPEVQEWVNRHKNDAIHEIAFKKSPFTNITIQELLTQINGKNKLSHKVDWLTKRNDILYPPSLNLEQSSSWVTAQYKANLFNDAENIVDLTGGFGIDSMAFAENAEKIIHLEPNLELQAIANHNFKVLGLNISSLPLTAEDFIQKYHQSKNFFLDPSRRDENKKKVFLFSDLSPNPLFIIEKIKGFKKIIIKLSPLFDLTALVENFPSSKTIHIVAVKNEVKEILVELENEYDGDLTISAVNLLTDDEDYKFVWGAEYKPKTFSEVKKYIYEPNAAIQKTQNFLSLEKKYNMSKLAPNTHLWTSDVYYPEFPGRVYEFLKLLKNLKKELKNQSIQLVHRNFPENIKILIKRYKINPDGTIPVIFTSDTKKALSFWAKRLK